MRYFKLTCNLCATLLWILVYRLSYFVLLFNFLKEKIKDGQTYCEREEHMYR